MYSPLRVSTRTISPSSMKSGTWTSTPDSSVAGLLPPPEAVSPLTPGLGLASPSSRSRSAPARRSAVRRRRGPRPSALGSSHCIASPTDVGRDLDLLVVAVVHEDRGVAGVVEVLHLARLGAHRAELLAGPEGLVDHRAVLDPAQLGAHEGAALARLDVLELDDLEDLAVDLDVGAVLELVGAEITAANPRGTATFGTRARVYAGVAVICALQGDLMRGTLTTAMLGARRDARRGGPRTRDRRRRARPATNTSPQSTRSAKRTPTRTRRSSNGAANRSTPTSCKPAGDRRSPTSRPTSASRSKRSKRSRARPKTPPGSKSGSAS